MKALEPLKIISSKDGGPYAYQSKLSWCIVGPIQNFGHQNSLKFNRVAVKDAPTSKLSRYHFPIADASKDMSIEQMFEQMYYSDFTEKGAQIEKIDGNLEQLSKNDRIFLEILDAGTKKNRNHYEVPLPFKQKGIKIKKNRSQALKRMHQLKRRLKRDSSFFQDYQCFMDELVANGFSRKALRPQLMTVPGIYHIMEFTTLVNLVKLGLCLIAVLSFMEHD